MKRPALRISDVMDSPKLLGSYFKGPSWDRWRAVVKAAFAEPMTGAEIAAFREIADRDPPGQRVAELVCAVGRGGGKDSVASLMATSAAVNFDPRGKLRPGERAYVLCLACDKTQAGIVLGYIQAYFEQIAPLRALVKSVDQDGIAAHNIPRADGIRRFAHSNCSGWLALLHRRGGSAISLSATDAWAEPLPVINNYRLRDGGKPIIRLLHLTHK
jgi:hypothetical protein